MIFCSTEEGLNFRYISREEVDGNSLRLESGPNDLLIINNMDGVCRADVEYNNGFYELLPNEALTLFYPMGKWNLNLQLSGNEPSLLLLKVDVIFLHCLLTGDAEPEYRNVVREGYFPAQKGSGLDRVKISPQVRLFLYQIISPPVGSAMLQAWMRAKITEYFTVSLDGGKKAAPDTRCPFLQHAEVLEKIRELNYRLIEIPDGDSVVAKAAAEWQMSEHALRGGFKKAFGKSVKEFCHEIKMERARELLTTSDSKVNEVAYELGYSNPSHFIAAFKKKFGSTPSHFASNRN